LSRTALAAALAYFALIGLGFMFVEIGLLSRLNSFLGHPTLALAVLLGGVIFFTGVGSLLSRGIDPSVRRWALAYPLVPGAFVLIVALCMPQLLQYFAGASTLVRSLVSLGSIVPPALGMGLCFPLGLRLCERIEPRLGPWVWSINGAFGVCASGLGLMSSMAWGITCTLWLGAGCYLLLPIATVRLAREAQST
jgi:predicted membrane-bound spermidine synthase